MFMEPREKPPVTRKDLQNDMNGAGTATAQRTISNKLHPKAMTISLWTYSTVQKS